jgi:predicted MFS family arabinose efflux permease
VLRARAGSAGPRFPLASLLATTVALATPLYLMLPVLPFAVRDAGGSTAAAGVITGALAVGTVVFELATPRLLGHARPSTLLVGAFVLSCAATLGLAVVDTLPVLVALGGLYGIGLGLGGTVISIVPGVAGAGARRSAFAVYGFGSTFPAIVGPPTALLTMDWIGSAAVFVACAVVCVVGAACARAATRPLAAVARRAPAPSAPDGDRRITLLGYACVTFTFGAVASFAAIHLDGGGLASAAAFFVVFGVARVVFRTLAPHLLAVATDGALVTAGMLAAAGGLACLAAGEGALVLVAGVLYGAGLGTSQVMSHVASFGRSHESNPSGAAEWNFATDAGMGLGALALPPLASAMSYGSAFALLPVMPLIGLTLHRLGGRRAPKVPA